MNVTQLQIPGAPSAQPLYTHLQSVASGQLGGIYVIYTDTWNTIEPTPNKQDLAELPWALSQIGSLMTAELVSRAEPIDWSFPVSTNINWLSQNSTQLPSNEKVHNTYLNGSTDITFKGHEPSGLPPSRLDNASWSFNKPWDELHLPPQASDPAVIGYDSRSQFQVFTAPEVRETRELPLYTLSQVPRTVVPNNNALERYILTDLPDAVAKQSWDHDASYSSGSCLTTENAPENTPNPGSPEVTRSEEGL
ncbi:hypothetical protein TWF506_004670 [Arthrobotrys conoides]|uniref:Uncharacterized protein n=1 Tax=Arthrobotrys conoides TaxID=74498 RepID=A0AAN8RI49_9PEZI